MTFTEALNVLSYSRLVWPVVHLGLLEHDWHSLLDRMQQLDAKLDQ